MVMQGELDDPIVVVFACLDVICCCSRFLIEGRGRHLAADTGTTHVTGRKV
jgi:hypothetical protein